MSDLFFVSSKFAWALLSPGNILLIAFILGVLLLLFNRHKLAKTLLLPSALAGLLVLIYPVGDWLIAPLEKRFASPLELPKNIAGIIVLGGGEDLKRSISWQVNELGLAGDRYIGAAVLAKAYPKAKVFFSGGSGSIQLQNTQKEGHLAQQLLQSVGIAAERIIIEDQSRNTYENFRNLASLLDLQNSANKPYLLVTSAFHMPRAIGVARQRGVKVMAYPVDYRSSAPALRQWEFDFYDHLKTLEPAWREWIGLTVYYFSNKTQALYPEPKNTPQDRPKSP